MPLGEYWPLLGEYWPLLGEYWPLLGEYWPLLGEYWPLLGEYWALLGEYWALLGECFRVLGLVASFTSTRYYYCERNIPDGIPSGILKFLVLPSAAVCSLTVQNIFKMLVMQFSFLERHLQSWESLVSSAMGMLS